MGFNILALGVRVSPIYFRGRRITCKENTSKEYKPNYFNMLLLRMYFSDSVELRWILGGKDDIESSLNSIDLLKAI